VIIAAAQINPFKGDVTRNLEVHKHFILRASQKNSQLIVFPEMSLTSYVRKEAANLSFAPNDERLDSLRILARQQNIIVIAGAPIALKDKLFIGAFIFYPDGTSSIYTKQYLHPGEEEFFSPAYEHNPIITLDDERIALAICADIDNPKHPSDAAKAGATIYIPSIFFSREGIPEANAMLAIYAKQHSLNIMMANFCGPVWERIAGGGSGFWAADGTQLGVLDESRPGLLIAAKHRNRWSVSLGQ
jgi:predicted amidohydrolase